MAAAVGNDHLVVLGNIGNLDAIDRSITALGWRRHGWRLRQRLPAISSTFALPALLIVRYSEGGTWRHQSDTSPRSASQPQCNRDHLFFRWFTGRRFPCLCGMQHVAPNAARPDVVLTKSRRGARFVRLPNRKDGGAKSLGHAVAQFDPGQVLQMKVAGDDEKTEGACAAAKQKERATAINVCVCGCRPSE